MTTASMIPVNVVPSGFRSWAEAVSAAADSLGNYTLKSANLSDLANAATARSNLGLGSAATQADNRYAHRSNNLSDLVDPAAARSNLGLGSAATQADTRYAHRANNLSDLTSASTARTNLGLGTSATQATTVYAHVANNLSDLTSASTARTNLGLGSAAQQADTRYAHRSNNLSDLANAATARTNLGLGSAAQQDDIRYAHRANNLSDLADTETARSNLGANNASNLTTGTLPDARLSANVPIAQSQTISLGGEFSGTNHVKCVRIGDIITITQNQGINATAADTVLTSAVGAIPAAYRPVYNIRLGYHSSTIHYTVTLSSAGTLSIEGRSLVDGSLTAFGGVLGGINLSFCV